MIRRIEKWVASFPYGHEDPPDWYYEDRWTVSYYKPGDPPALFAAFVLNAAGDVLDEDVWYGVEPSPSEMRQLAVDAWREVAA